MSDGVGQHILLHVGIRKGRGQEIWRQEEEEEEQEEEEEEEEEEENEGEREVFV